MFEIKLQKILCTYEDATASFISGSLCIRLKTISEVGKGLTGEFEPS